MLVEYPIEVTIEKNVTHSTLEYALFSKSDDIKTAGGCCYSVFRGESTDTFRFALSLNFGLCRPFDVLVLTVTIVQ